VSLKRPLDSNDVRTVRKMSADRPHQLLVVDGDPDARRTIERSLRCDRRRVHVADSLAVARRTLEAETIDLALIDHDLPDGAGVALAAEIAGRRAPSRSIMLAGEATVDGAVAAMRAGARDLIAKPINLDQLKRCVGVALEDLGREQRRRRRVAQLRQLCRRLNAARHEISQQVDILCHDLVSAYQELACQVHCIEQTAELRTVLNSELDLEQVLRHVMQFLLDKIGPANIVVFLPAPGAGYTVGGYVNYSFTAETIKAAASHLADEAAPAIAEQAGVVRLGDDESIRDWFGEAASWVTGSAVLAVPCLDEEAEPLAALMLFRSSDAEFDQGHADLLEAAGPVIANHLARVVRVHNRHHDLFDDEEEDEGFGFDSLPF